MPRTISCVLIALASGSILAGGASCSGTSDSTDQKAAASFSVTNGADSRALCPTEQQLTPIIAAARKASAGSVQARIGRCFDGWIYGGTAFWLPGYGDDGGYGWSDGWNTVLRWSDGTWMIVLLGGTGNICGPGGEVPSDLDEQVSTMPAWVREKIGC